MPNHSGSLSIWRFVHNALVSLLLQKNTPANTKPKAGLCVQESSQRNAIITLVDACEDRTGWPMSTIRNDLLAEWRRVDQDGNT